MPCGPSSVASDCATASSAALVALYGPIVRCENLTTIELTMVTDPAVAASASANRRVSRSAPSTFTSKAALTASRSTLDRSLIGGIASALCTRASTRPNSARAASRSRSAAAGSAMSVGTASAFLPTAVISLATPASRDSVRAASTTSAPCSALRTAIERPSPGPIPATTMTLCCSSIRAPCRSSQHPPGDGGLAGGDPPGVLIGRDRRLRGEWQPLVKIGEFDHFGARAVRPSQVPREALPAELNVAAAVPGALQPVRDPRVALADHEPEHPVRIGPGLVGGEAGLVVDVVERDVPPAAELDPLVGSDRLGRGGDSHDHGLGVVEVVVPDRGELGAQPAGGGPRLGQRVGGQVEIEPPGKGEERLQPRDEDLARHAVPLGERARVRSGRRRAGGVSPADRDDSALLAGPVAVDLADDQHRRA